MQLRKIANHMLGACLLFACGTTGTQAGDSANTDNGKLIVTISSEPNKIYLAYTLNIRKRDHSEHRHLDNAAYNWLSPDKNDFTGPDENGMVVVTTLPAGDWELYGEVSA